MAYIDTKITTADLAVGSSLCVQLGDAQVGLFRNSEGFFAMDNVCPHQGAPLHEGFMTEGFVSCPWHQWQFQFTDGKCRNIPGVRVASYPLEVRDGTIWVSLEGDAKP